MMIPKYFTRVSSCNFIDRCLPVSNIGIPAGYGD